MKRVQPLLALALALAVMGTATNAADKAKQSTALSGLDNPCGVAVQPETGKVFVSDSAAGRVLMLNGSKAVPVITGFPQDVYGKGPKYDIGPLGLAFIDKQTLIVGGGGLKDGAELLRIYTLPGDSETLSASQMKMKLGPLVPSDDTLNGEGNFYGVATDGTNIFVTCNGDDTKGWVSKVDLNAETPELKPFIKTKVAVEVDAPVGVTLAADGQLVISQMGEMNVEMDSLLSFYDASSGRLMANAKTGLYDIADLAYSPKSGKLYVVDFAWMDTSKGGLFRLDVKQDGDAMKVTAEKILSLDKPSALAFSPDGTLYVTVFGTAKEGASKKPGKLLKIEGDL